MTAADASGRSAEARDLDALVAAIAAAGDRQAFAALFAVSAPRLKSFLLRQGFSDGESEDLVQDTMLAVWRKATAFDPAKASAITWIFTIARNLGIDRRRRAGRRPVVDGSDLPEDADPTPSVESTLVRREDEDRVRVALERLPPDQATVITLSYFAEQPQTAIAEALGIPLGTVKSRVRLALGRLRQLLEDTAP